MYGNASVRGTLFRIMHVHVLFLSHTCMKPNSFTYYTENTHTHITHDRKAFIKTIEQLLHKNVLTWLEMLLSHKDMKTYTQVKCIYIGNLFIRTTATIVKEMGERISVYCIR